jgi:molybdate transport system ATP-binding protein
MIRFDCRLARPGFTVDVAFEADRGVTALFGPSGSGKTTVIRLLAGLLRADAGRIEVDGTVLLDTASRVFVPAFRRRMGLVFQDALLLPHLTVRGNLAYGRWFAPRSARRLDIASVVEVLGIGHLLGRWPQSLSGGERQRVAIGRALLSSPTLLAMDEPFASLDMERKLEILPFVERLRDEFNVPIVYVSHSVEEVARLASTVVKIEAGKVVATGSPATVLSMAAVTASDRFSAVSVVSARVDRHDPDYGVTLLHHPAGPMVVPGHLGEPGHDVRVMIHATNVTLAVGPVGQVSVRTVLSGVIDAIDTDASPFLVVTVALPGGERIKASATRLAIDALALRIGDPVHALVKTAAIDERSLARWRPGE